MSTFAQVQREIISCSRCPRLVTYLERISQEKVKRYREWKYWGKPVPSFGDPTAQLLVVGLAPAAHGGNRTGRAFTGDRSGDWLYGALYEAGFANQPTSTDKRDGLRLHNCCMTSAIHCAPPDNKPLREEFLACRSYLVQELQLLKRIRVVVTLGQIAFQAYLTARRELGVYVPSPKPRFGHGVRYEMDEITLIGSYHPSQQNTFTGRLTKDMFESVFQHARQLVDEGK